MMASCPACQVSRSASQPVAPPCARLKKFLATTTYFSNESWALLGLTTSYYARASIDTATKYVFTYYNTFSKLVGSNAMRVIGFWEKQTPGEFMCFNPPLTSSVPLFSSGSGHFLWMATSVYQTSAVVSSQRNYDKQKHLFDVVAVKQKKIADCCFLHSSSRMNES